MALSLTAEQKTLDEIFIIKQQYVIPPFQRPYSWGYEQCFQLYNDLMKSYNEDENYFLGNIIIAKGEKNKDYFEVIDGQQRLTTLLLFIKVLHIYSNIEQLENSLTRKTWAGKVEPRIKSEIFETNDSEKLNEVLNYSKNDFENRLEICKDKKGNYRRRSFNSKFERNALYLYDWIAFYLQKNKNLNAFIRHFLENITLLPIQLVGKTQDEANEKALVIFETMNNRGMNLEDADIFKAKLYKRAKAINEEKEFIESWTEFKNNCEKLNLRIDDIFRYYSHIIRGQQGISSSEINLREFFTREKFSPFEFKDYNSLLGDLFRITEIIEFINQEKNKKSELAKWLQLIEAYTNQYPKFALVTYLFENDFKISDELLSFLESIVRYVYSQGSTTTVKFEIYTIIKFIFNKKSIKDYKIEMKVHDFNYLGRLKYGYALLAYYADKNEALPNYSVDKIVNRKDKNVFGDRWDENQFEELKDTLGNFIILDLPKKNLSFEKKISHYRQSEIDDVKTLLHYNFNFDDLLKRDEILKNKLVNFFNKNTVTHEVNQGKTLQGV